MTTEIIFSGGTIDIFDNQIALTFSLSDVRNFNDRYSTFSKTIKLPGTKNNNNVFENIFEIAADMYGNISFDPNKRLPVQILVDTIVQANGYIQLKKIIKNNDDGSINYQIQFYGLNSTLIKSIEDLYISDLDFSEYDHCFSMENIRHSWTASTENGGFVYPMIDYGMLSNNVNIFSSIYNIVWNWFVADYRPAIYIKTILDKIFTNQGMSYTSNFFNSEFFKKLIIPFGNAKFMHNQDWCDTQHFKAYQNQNYYLTKLANNTSVGFHLYFPDVTSPGGFTSYSDCANNHLTYYGGTLIGNGFGLYDVRQAGQYSFYAQALCTTTGTAPDVVTSVLAIEVKNLYNGSNYEIVGSASNQAAVAFTQVLSAQTPVLFLVPGDQVTCWYYLSGQTNNTVVGTVVASPADTFFKTTHISDCEVTLGEYYSLNDNLPQNIKQTDFIKSLVTMFNLYIEPDPNYQGNYIIEPWSSFYSGTTQDWTNKLDISQPVEVSVLSNIQPKQINLSYTPDNNDHYLNDYFEENKITYGEKIILNDNVFSDEKKYFEVLFSPTVIRQQSKAVATNWIVPEIFPKDTDERTATKSTPRILMYNGLVTLSATPIYTQYGAHYFQIENNYWEDDLQYIATLADSYPEASTFDNPTNSDVDINFGLCNEYYFASTGITQNNLYNTYYDDYFNELLSKNSKLVTGYFNLKESDIQNLSFRNQIFVDGVYYKLNKVIDYKPGQNQLTKVELIFSENFSPSNRLKKFVKQKNSLNNNNIQNNKATNTFGNYSYFNIVAGKGNSLGTIASSNNVSGDNNKVGSLGAIVNGLNNSGYSFYSAIIGTSGSTNGYLVLTSGTTSGATNLEFNSQGEIITGKYNLVAGGTNHKNYGINTSIIGGNNNYILSGINNSSVIGASNITANTSNTTYVDILNVSGTTINNFIPVWSLWTGSSTNGTLLPVAGGNTVLSSSYSSILGGLTNIISASTQSFNYGYQNQILSSDYSTINGGQTNEILSSLQSGIFSSKGCSINTLAEDSTILGSTNSEIRNISEYSVIVGGLNNLISIDNINARAYLVGGNSNAIYGNSLISTSEAGIIGGDNNTMISVINSSIYSSRSSSISGTSGLGTTFCSVVNGFFSNIIQSSYSNIFGGYYNIVSGATYSNIIGGSNNLIPTGLINVNIIGRSGLTAATNNTTYVEGLNVNSLVGASTQMVVASTDGTLGVQAIPTGGSGGITGATNGGAGTSLVSGNTSTDAVLKSLSAGTNIVFNTTASTSNITINSSYDFSKYRRTGGYWYHSATFAAAMSTNASLTASRMYASPLIITNATGQTIGGLGCAVTASGSSAVGLAIYNDDGNCFPSTLVYGGTSSYTGSCLTVATLTFTGISSVVLMPGLYWLVTWASASSGSLKSAVNTHGIPQIVASTTIQTSNAMCCYIHANTWNGGTMPTTFPNSAPSTLNATPFVWFRVD